MNGWDEIQLMGEDFVVVLVCDMCVVFFHGMCVCMCSATTQPITFIVIIIIIIINNDGTFIDICHERIVRSTIEEEKFPTPSLPIL